MTHGPPRSTSALFLESTNSLLGAGATTSVGGLGLNYTFDFANGGATAR